MRKKPVTMSLAAWLRIILVDITPPCIGGIKATRQIKAALSNIQVVFLTIHENKYNRTYAMSAGASACILESQMWTKLLPTLTSLPSTTKTSTRM